MKTTDTPLISVIVPVYNIENYIERCLNSLQAQSMKDIEIIIIDDGSTDRSGQICDAFAEKDSRFKVIHKNNEGLSAARNDGLDISRGKYIMFVDGDDWVDPKFCEDPYNVVIETNSEIVIFEWAYHKYDNEETIIWYSNIPNKGYISKEDLYTKQRESIYVVAWNKIYHRRLFEEIRYPFGLLSEDSATTHHLIHKAKSIFLLDVILYFHRYSRPNSITTERPYRFQIDEAHFFFLRQFELFQWGYIKIEKVVDSAIFYLMRMGRNAELSDKCDDILRKSNYLTGSSIMPKRKMMTVIYKVSPLLFDLVCNVSGKRIHKFNKQ